MKMIGLGMAMLLMPIVVSAAVINLGTPPSLTAEGYTYFDTGAQAVTLTDTDGINDTATAFLLIEDAGYINTNILGIYGFTTSGSTVTIGNTLEVFRGLDSVGLDVKLKFDLGAGTVINMHTGASADIGKIFGFYLSTEDNKTYYSHIDLNEDKKDHALLFDTSAGHSGLYGSDVVVAFEDLYDLGDQDYNDLVAGVTDVKPVPEPGTMMLLGSGLVGLAGWGRKKFRK